MTKLGHRVYVSEYDAPMDFTCIWSSSSTVTLSTTKIGIEKLFVHECSN